MGDRSVDVMRAKPAQYVGDLVVVQKVDHRMRREQTGAQQGQIRVLTVEAICISVECEVVEVEEPLGCSETQG